MGEVYVNVIDTLGSELGTKYAKLDDDKLRYDASDEEHTSFSCTWTKNQDLVIIWLTMIEENFIYIHYIPGIPNISTSYVMDLFLPIDWYNKSDRSFYFMPAWRLYNQNSRFFDVIIYNRIER